MRYKRIIVLASVCAVLGVGVYLNGNKPKSSSASAISQGIADPAKIAAITLKSKDSGATLVLKDGAWKVADKQDFPADFNMIKDLVSQFHEMKVDRSFDADDETIKRLGLSPDLQSDIKSASISFADKAGKSLGEYIMGASRKGGGQYFVTKDSKVVHVSLREFLVAGKTSKDLMNRKILDTDKSKLVKIVCEKAGQAVYTIERKKDSDGFVLAGKEEGSEIDESKISGLSGFMSPLMIDDIASEKRPAKPGAAVLSFELKDGSVCRIIPAEKKEGDAEDNCFNIEVSKADGDAGLMKGMDLAKFSFFMPGWKLDTLVTEKASLYKKTEAKPEEKAAPGAEVSKPKKTEAPKE